MTSVTAQVPNLNDARSSATRHRLVDSTIECLVELGFSKTTGVEVCRRAQLTRGALNHHFPDFADLLIATLEQLYQRLLDITVEAEAGPLEQILLEGHQRVIQPEFKAVIELWLASRNDAAIGLRLAQAIARSAELFSPEMFLAQHGVRVNTEDFEPHYRAIIEALIGIGLGRAIGDGEPMAHEPMVLQVLTEQARQFDRR